MQVIGSKTSISPSFHDVFDVVRLASKRYCKVCHGDSLFILLAWIKRSIEDVICECVILPYLVVTPHIRTDQSKTADNPEDSARHIQCKFQKSKIVS